MNNILVVGADGQLGSSIRRISSNYSFEFIFTDYKELDITSKESVDNYFILHKPDFVINCAAYTAVDKAESEPDKAELLNNRAVSYLAAAAQRENAVLIHISTDYVFGGNNPNPIDELEPTAPVSVYGQTKLRGEIPVLSYTRGIVIRTAWLYSEYGNNFMKTMLRLGSQKESLDVVADQIGSPTYAGDLAEAIMKIISVISTKNERKEYYGIFHYSNEGKCSWYDFSRAIMHVAKLKCNVNAILTSQYPTAAKRPKYSLLSKEKIKQIYDISIPLWEDSLVVGFGRTSMDF